MRAILLINNRPSNPRLSHKKDEPLRAAGFPVVWLHLLLPNIVPGRWLCMTQTAFSGIMELGDNRDRSRDSRHIGSIHVGDMIGYLDYIYFPAETWSRLGLYRD